MRTLFALLLSISSAAAAESTLTLNIPYAQPKNERQSLDVYAPTMGKNHPVLIWIHGGGWRRGDKSVMFNKPQAFIDHGFVFVAINYRYFPNVTLKEMTGDCAKAIRWVYDHIAEYGGDPHQLVISGHSAGGHLTALVCTDGRYLQAEGLSLANIKASIPVDADAYDVRIQTDTVDPRRQASYRSSFGDEALQAELSPVTHIAKGRQIPPFLILHVADHPEVRDQSQILLKALRAAEVPAKTYAVENTNHVVLNQQLGVPDDGSTKATFAFLEETLRK